METKIKKIFTIAAVFSLVAFFLSQNIHAEETEGTKKIEEVEGSSEKPIEKLAPRYLLFSAQNPQGRPIFVHHPHRFVKSAFLSYFDPTKFKEPLSLSNSPGRKSTNMQNNHEKPIK